MTQPMAPDVPGRKPDQRLGREAVDFYDALAGFQRVYQFRDRDRICCHDLSVTQFYALDALVRRRGQTLNGLAGELYLEKSSASRVVDGLVGKGYVTRRTHPEDRRAILLEPTEEGRRLHGVIVAEGVAREEALLGEFEPDVRRGMVRLLERLTEAAEQRVRSASGACCIVVK